MTLTPVSMEGRMYLEDLFAGDDNQDVRRSVIETGRFINKGSKKELHVQLRPTDDGRHEVMALAAITRDPGLTDDSLATIQDFANLGSKPTNNLVQKVRQYKEIYLREGMINNAVNKIAALIGSGGRYKVRRARRGKTRKAVEDLQRALDYFASYVNGADEFSVVTSERGMSAVLHSAARHALVEGDWVARQQWTTVQVTDAGKYSLPMLLQTISLVNLEPVKELAGLGEFWYWKPDSELLTYLGREDLPADIKRIIKRLLDSKMLNELKKNQRVLLTPALLLHVKYRGFAHEPVGESLIEPAKMAIRYSRAIMSADLVSMENVINRLTIVQVGSADKNSPYSKPDVAAARAALMQSFFEDMAPNMVIVWQGDDVKVNDVGSQSSVLALDDRFKVAEAKVRSAVGLPEALLVGATGDGGVAQWASVLGASAQMQELANSFAAVLTTLGERIAKENGFDDVDVIWEFDESLFVDHVAERTQNRADYKLGLLSIRSMIAGTGRDPDAEFRLKCEERGLDPNTSTFEEAFKPPQGLQGQALGGIQGEGLNKTPGEGRTPDAQNDALPEIE